MEDFLLDGETLTRMDKWHFITKLPSDDYNFRHFLNPISSEGLMVFLENFFEKGAKINSRLILCVKST